MKKILQKRCILVLVLFALVLGVLCSEDATAFAKVPSGRNEITEGNIIKSINVLTVPIGDSKGELSLGAVTVGDPSEDYEEGPVFDGGPSSYAVSDDGYFYIIDSYKEPASVVVYDKTGKYVKTVDAKRFTSHEYGILNVTAHESSLYVLTFDGLFCEYDIKTDTITEYAVPKGVLSNSNRGIKSVGDSIVFLSYDPNHSTWAFNTETHAFFIADDIFSVCRNTKKDGYTVKFSDKQFFVPTDDAAKITPLGIDGESNLIVEYNYDGISYRKYSESGNIAGYIEETYSDQKMYLCDIVCVAGGELMRARCDGGKYMIDRLIFGEYDGQKAKSTVTCFYDLKGLKEEDSEEYFDEPDLSRDEVIARADEMLNLEWSVQFEENVTDSEDITVPKYMCSISLKDAPVGKKFKGIPYCWGGMNGIGIAGEDERQQDFLSQIMLGYKAGNVKNEGRYKSGSAGVDCSGFTSLCYGFNIKRHSTWFYNYYGHLLQSYDELKKGDYLVKLKTPERNGHVMVVYEPSESSTGDILIAESTTRRFDLSGGPMDVTSGKTTNGTVLSYRPYSFYKDFLPKTPWHTWDVLGNYVMTTCPDCEIMMLRGDANNDEVVNTADAVMIMRYCAGLVNLTYKQTIIADNNADGIVNTADVSKLLLFVLNGYW